MSPKNKFYEVGVKMEIETDSGKIKKQNVRYLVDAADTTSAEANTLKLLDGTMNSFEIVSIKLSNIQEVWVDE